VTCARNQLRSDSRRTCSERPLLALPAHCDDNLLPINITRWRRRGRRHCSAQHKVRRNQVWSRPHQDLRNRGVLSKGDDPQASQYTLKRCRRLWPMRTAWPQGAAHAHGRKDLWATEAGVDSSSTAATSTTKHCRDEKARDVLVPTLYLEDWMLSMQSSAVFHQKMLDTIAWQEQHQARDASRREDRMARCAVYPHG